jgi:hypothetical protein
VRQQVGFFEHTSYLARGLPEDPDRKTMMYLRHLGSTAAESYLARCGRAMLESLLDETTQLLIDLCTNFDARDRWSAYREIA